MTDTRVERLADILVGYSLPVEEGQLVTIRGHYVAEPLILALYERCLERGAHPLVRTSIPQTQAYFYRFANEQQLEFVWETERWMAENIDATFDILADTNTRQLSGIDPQRQAMVARSRKPLVDRFFERTAAGDVRWNLTMFPTEAYAMDAEMSLAEYEDLFYGACLIDAPDPVAEWGKVAERHARLIEWMRDRSEVHIEGEGTDILLEVSGRLFLPADGKENFPDGEIFTGPLEDRTRGHVTFSYPAIFGGHEVEGVRLVFEAGRVVEASATKHEDYLIKTLDTDPGARVVGELGIGTNYGIESFTGELLLDEKMGGTIHLALGASYPETGGANTSAIHWDMVCDLRRGGRITVDGDVLMEDGKLLV